MFKKCLMAILACSLVTGPLKTEETSESYLKQLWNSFAKKADTIAQYGNRDYMRAFVVSSIWAVPLGFQLWISRNDMIENLVYDAHGKLTGNQDELFAWLKKLNDAGGATVHQNFCEQHESLDFY